MREDLAKPQAQPPDPVELARREQRKTLPRRFYEVASVIPRGKSFALALDSKAAKTPAKHDFVLPTRALAEAIAAEWAAQATTIDFAKMPLTRLGFTAIDGVAARMAAVIDDIAKYAETDLVCYRAAEPRSLADAQTAAWDPVLDFAATQLGARFVCAEGIMFVAQSEDARAAVKAWVAATGDSATAPFALTALSVMTALTGSVLIALALTARHLSLDQAWRAAHVDEDFQIRQWGEDHAAKLRRQQRLADMEAAEALWRLLKPPA
jgi:chaperone required for assembly of F1-ATPase